MLTFESYESGNVLVLTVEDAGYNAPSDRQAANREWLYNTVQVRENPRFAVDLGAVSYLSSADFGILISLKRRIDARKGRLVLFQVSSFVVDTLQTMRLATFFTIVEDLRAAVSLLESAD
ncbi:MAG: STAS domain-containing protein [Isosphaeraceae bacterium]|nr:STAS domain-containing protein [Isosphaeraceae bacterium]